MATSPQPCMLLTARPQLPLPAARQHPMPVKSLPVAWNGANFVGASLDGTSFYDADAQRTVFSETILDVGTMENADLTKSLWPSSYRIMVCDMDTLKGKNSVTGVYTSESFTS